MLAKSTCSVVTTCVAIAIYTSASSSFAVGPTSEYYLNDSAPTISGSSQYSVYQGGTLLRTWPGVGHEEYAFVVLDTVRSIGFENNPARTDGAEYSLAGVPTGQTYINPEPSGPSISRFFDATTDGQFNYTMSLDEGYVMRTDTDWTNPVVLFDLGTSDGFRIGIAYDHTNDTLWLSGWDGGVESTIENRTLSGSLITQFSTGHDKNAALALDPVDDTLWLNDADTNLLEQYSKSGQLLSTLETPAGFRPLAGEFRVPEPATLSLLALGGMALLRRRKKQPHGITGALKGP